MSNPKIIKIKIEREIVESIASDAINMFVREVLVPNKFIRESYFDLSFEEFQTLRSNVLRILSKNYESVEVYSCEDQN